MKKFKQVPYCSGKTHSSVVGVLSTIFNEQQEKINRIYKGSLHCGVYVKRGFSKNDNKSLPWHLTRQSKMITK